MRRLVPPVLAGLALAAPAAASEPPAPVVKAGFASPSRNIVCNAGPHRTGRPLIACTVLSLAGTRRGQRVWSMFERGRVYSGWILGNAAVDVPVVRYGSGWRYRGFRCVSARAGVTCRNVSGHGFFLSRERQRIF